MSYCVYCDRKSDCTIKNKEWGNHCRNIKDCCNSIPDSKIENRDRRGDTPAGNVVFRGNLVLLHEFIHRNVNMFALNDCGMNFVHLASRYGHNDVLLWLLNSKYTYDINAKTTDGSTAIILASYGTHSETIQILFTHGADPTITSNRGDNIFHLGSSSDCETEGDLDTVSMSYIIAPECIDKPNNDGNRPFMESDNVDILKLFIDKGVDIYTSGKDGNNVLHNCANNVNDEMILYLCNKIRKDLDTDDEILYPQFAQENNISVPIDEITESQKYKYYKFISQIQNSMVNMKNEKGFTPIIMCILSEFGNFDNIKNDCIKILLENGADPNICDNEGKSALFYIVNDSDEELINIFKDFGANFDIVDNEGRTIFHYAAKNWSDIIENADAYGINISTIRDNYGNTPLIYASSHENRHALNEEHDVESEEETEDKSVENNSEEESETESIDEAEERHSDSD